MNPFDFTPGPWSVDYDPRNPNDILCDHVLDSTGKAVCFMAAKSDNTFDEMEANAKAISAVPDLIQACINSLACCYETRSDLGKELYAALKKAGVRDSAIPIRAI